MYTIISTLTCMGFANKLSEGLESSTVLTFEDAIKSPEKLDGCEYLGLVFNNEGVELPANVEDLIFDVLSLNGRLKKIKYMFSICLCMKSVGYALMIVEKLCRKYGHTPELSLSFTTRSKNNVDVNKALYHIRSQNHIIATGRIGSSLYMASHGIWTGRMREEEKKIEEHADIFERARRTTRWTAAIFFLLIMYILFLFFAVRKLARFALIPHMLNLLGYGFLTLFLFALMKFYMRFPIRRLVAQERRFYLPLFLLGFFSMAVPAVAISFIYKAVNPDSFKVTFSDNWALSYSLGFLMSLVKSFLFMLLGGSYTVYYRRDYMPTGRKRIIAYCLIGAVIFSLLHFRNPRFSVSLAVCQMGLHFILGFELMAFLLRTKGIEVSWGISFAYTLLRSVLFADGEVSSPGALYTFNGNAGPMMLFLGIVFTVLSSLIVSFLLKGVLRKEACRHQPS